MADHNFDSLRLKLEEQMSYPAVYMFKFIVLADNQKIAQIESFFSPEADLHHKESNGGKYISITAKEVVMSTDEIIEIYKKASAIEGVVAL
jgi:putative lipoic acid-binding regulatory protein